MLSQITASRELALRRKSHVVSKPVVSWTHPNPLIVHEHVPRHFVNVDVVAAHFPPIVLLNVRYFLVQRKHHKAVAHLLLLVGLTDRRSERGLHFLGSANFLTLLVAIADFLPSTDSLLDQRQRLKVLQRRNHIYLTALILLLVEVAV